MLVYDAPTGQYNAEATPEFGETTLEMFFKQVGMRDGRTPNIQFDSI